MKIAWWIAELLVVIGAINWGLIGVADFNLVEAILGGGIARIVYIFVGISGIWAIKLLMGKKSAHTERPAMSPEPGM